MKKIFAIFAIFTLALALFACGRDKNKTTNPPAATTTTMTNNTANTSTSKTAASTSTSATTKENSHPTATGGTTASQNARGGTMPEIFTMPPTGTAPGGSTSVR